jgi:hypothetical protein
LRFTNNEASLSELQDAISRMSARLFPELRQEIEPEPLTEVSTVLAVGKTNTAKRLWKIRRPFRGQQKGNKMERESEEKEEQVENMRA